MIHKSRSPSKIAFPAAMLFGLTCAALFLAFTGPAPAATSGGISVAQIGALARAHRHAALVELNGRLQKSGVEIRMAYLVGRFFSDPKAERGWFVASFPTSGTDARELYLVTPRVVREHGTYLFGVLADIANAGDEEAIRRLSLVAADSDGALGEYVSVALGRVASKRPGDVLTSLAALPRGTADKVARNPMPWCDSAREVAGVRPKSDRIAALQQVIRASAVRC